MSHFKYATGTHKDAELGAQVPPHPGSGWTRFVCISDTHSNKYHVPSGDVLLHAGDLSSWGRESQLKETVEWLKSLDHPVKIIVAGNHDLCLDTEWGEYGVFDATEIEQARAYVRKQAPSVHYLEYEPFRFVTPTGRTWKVYGSPAVPLYVQGAFQYESGTAEAKAIYDKIPNDTEILITHTPPHGILDETRRGSAGCKMLLSRLNDLKNCRLHVFGHIHEATGVRADKVGGTESPRVSVNAAMERYQSAIVVDLEN